MEKKWLVVTILATIILLGLGFVVAQDLLGPETYSISHSSLSTASTSEFLKQDFNSKYGMMTLNSDKDGKVAEYTITSTEEGVVSLIMYGEAVLYRDDILFDRMDSVGNVSGTYYVKLYRDNYVYVTDTEKEVCNIVNNKTSGKDENVCSIVRTYKTINDPVLDWKVYDNKTILKAGNYSWKFEGIRVKGQAVDLIPVSKGEAMTQWTWYSTNWSYRKAITISSTVVDYSVKLNVSKTSSMLSTFADLRFTNSSDNGEVSYWIEKYNSTDATVWIKVPVAGMTSYYMYYGNSSTVTTTSNIRTTFIFGDEFDSLTDWSSRYTNVSSNGNITVVGGKLFIGTRASQVNDYALVKTQSLIASINTSIMWSQYGTKSGGHVGVGMDNCTGTSVYPCRLGVNYINRDIIGTTPSIVLESSSGGTISTVSAPSDASRNYAKYEILRNSTMAQLRFNDTITPWVNKTTNIPTTTTSIAVYSEAGSYANASDQIAIDWWALRKINSNGEGWTEPSVSIGTEESAPSSDSCTPPAVNNNWIVQWKDNCSLNTNTNLGTGNFTLNGTAGQFWLNATLLYHNIYMDPQGTFHTFIRTSYGKTGQI